MSNGNIKRKAVEGLQDEYGKRLLDLDTCEAVFRDLLKQEAALKKELDSSNSEGLIGATLLKVKNVTDQSKSILEETKTIIYSIDKDLKELEEVRKEFKKRSDKLHTLQTTYQYMTVIQQVESLCIELQREFPKKDDEKCVTLFANLTEITRLLVNCPVTHLKEYLKDTILYWYSFLKEKLGKDLDEVLKQIKWPFGSANFNLIAPPEPHVNKLAILVEYLLQIEIPQEIDILIPIPTGILSEFKPPCLPIYLLVEPIRKRFIYHFYGNRKTNRIDKPEWYFTQILTWIRDHQDYVDSWVQPILEKLGFHHINARIEFIRCLVHFGAEKLNKELPSLQYDDFLFSHTLDEALGFDKELKEIYKYPSTEPGVLVILTQASVLVKWLMMERKYASEKMDAILSHNSSEAFELLTSEVDDLKITTCADAFITLLQTITERYECLPQPGHRMQFLELQIELLDDFRVRLLQIINAEQGDYMDSKICMVANTLYYVENVLIDWGTMLHFLNLYYYKTQMEKEKPTRTNDLNPSALDLDSDSLFVEIISLYRHFRRDLLAGLAEAVLLEVKKQSWDYRREKWGTMKVSKEVQSLSLTPSACPIFEILARRLHQLEKKLHGKLFTMVWRNIATQLDAYLFEDLVMDNRFSEGGAQQLKFDVTRNLLPLFFQYTETPQYYFSRLIEACNLLNLSKGSALLLRETLLALEGATGIEDTRSKALQEIGVTNFGPQMAVQILNQRTDLFKSMN